MTKILITGSNGLLGEHLVKLLKNTDHKKVIATARGENRLQEKEGYIFHSMDICNKQNVRKVIGEEQPDYIIHAAAMTQVDQCEEDKAACWRTNVEATGYLIDAAKEAGAFFLFISTDFIFDGREGPYKEQAAPHPVNYYGESKLAAERLIEEAAIPFSILRTVLVYGVSEDATRSNIVLWVKKSLEEEKKIKVVDDQWRTPTLVEDLAEGCRLVIEKYEMTKEVASVYNISGKELLTPYQMALQVADYFDLDHTLITRADASTFQQKAKRPEKTGFILTQAERDLNYRPHSLSEGLAVMTDK